jgi:hypothetical protein
VRIATALGNRPDMNIAVMCQHFMAVVCGSAAGEGGHAPSKRTLHGRQIVPQVGLGTHQSPPPIGAMDAIKFGQLSLVNFILGRKNAINHRTVAFAEMNNVRELRTVRVLLRRSAC